MPNESIFGKISALAFLALALLQACAVTLPPAPVSSAADPQAPEGVTAPLHPTLLASSRTFLSPAADDREQAHQQKMKTEKMDHSMHDMSQMPEEKP